MKLNEIINNLKQEFKNNIELENSLEIVEVNLDKQFEMVILQVLIKSQNNQPISFDQIIKCNEKISLYLDQKYSAIEDDYGLEVSSFGIDHEIVDVAELKELVGENFFVETKECFEKDLDSFQGVLKKNENEDLFVFNFFIKGRPKKLPLKFEQIKKIKHLAK